MTQNPGSPGPDKPPADPRPQPRYGELAPEGWTWQPPAPAAPAADATDAPPSAQPDRVPVSAPNAPNGATSHVAPFDVVQTKPAAPTWDRPVTLALLVLGLFGTFFTVAVLNSIPQALQMLYTQEGLGTYTAAASVTGLILAGVITQGALWVVTAVVSVLVTLRRRRAFYIPLIGGVVSFIAIFVFLTFVLTTDSTLLDFYGQL